MPFYKHKFLLKDNVHRPYKPSNINIVYEKLLSILDQNSYANYTNPFLEPFRYKKLSNFTYKEMFDPHGKGEKWKARPVIEELWFSNIELLIPLVKKILEKNNGYIFLHLYMSIPDRDKVFAWSKEICAEISLEVDKLTTYSNKQNLNNAKKVVVKKLAEQLHSKLANAPQTSCTSVLDYSSRPSRGKASFCPNEKAYVEVLLYKLELLELLHSQDKALAVHRGWKRFILNFCTILFSIGIANSINYFTTGNFLFFNQTRTQKYANDVHDAIGLESGPEKIKVKAPLKTPLMEYTPLPSELADMVVGYT